jgi:hypothetical protein
MVTATTGTITFRGLKTGNQYSTSCYISDVVGAKVTFSPNGVAGTGSDTTVQFDEDVQIIDVAIITGPTVATGFSWYSRGVIVTNSATLISPNLTTNPNRNFPRIAFASGRLISAVQF